MIRRAAVLSALAVVAFAPVASATPHKEQADGCDHGASSKPCRPDPQPEHGKDCAEHGRHGGENEDHCLSTTTATTGPTTTTTTSPSSVDEPIVTSGATPSADSGPSSSETTPSITPLPARTTSPLSPASPTTSAELPRTGAGSTILVVLGGWLILGGLASLAMAQLIRGGR